MPKGHRSIFISFFLKYLLTFSRKPLIYASLLLRRQVINAVWLILLRFVSS
ncbi:hypothetical protein QWZ13_05165 [Reinekea marina]|uniref:hypothetical protein n=1 Tax=Reinekea marina TaxID=1310421 RepID=UPI0025B5515D|nr:hypothetical protein [Reinekea marina]MDN3647970.1 hypothetical protein [Reinekea marina]MDN3648298.1 hypothetical protein [Reinekea marina]